MGFKEVRKFRAQGFGFRVWMGLGELRAWKRCPHAVA